MTLHLMLGREKNTARVVVWQELVAPIIYYRASFVVLETINLIKSVSKRQTAFQSGETNYIESVATQLATQMTS